MKTNNYQGYSSNVGLIRFIAAVMVILSHAFPLSSGDSDREWFMIISSGGITMGTAAVAVFFFYSGLLVSRSIMKAPSAFQYFSGRIKRLIPPLAAVVVASVVIIGPAFTEMSIADYFSCSNTYLYLLNSILIPVHDLPGVFESNIFTSTVNGSLWTLPVEFLCYTALFIMYKINMLDKKNMKCLTVLCIILYPCINVLQKFIDLGLIKSLTFPSVMFFMGIVYFIFRDEIPMDGRLCIAAVIVIGIFGAVGFTYEGFFIGLPYILSYIGFACKRIPDIIGKLGNYSYGIYLSAFPIQQMLVDLFGGSMNIYLNMILSTVLSVLCGVVLFHCIEEKINSYLFKGKR